MQKSLDRTRLEKYKKFGPLTSVSTAGGLVLFADSPRVPEDRQWVIPLASARFTIPGFAAGQDYTITWSLIFDGDSPQATSFNPPPATIGDTAALFDTRNRGLMFGLVPTSFVASPDGTSALGLSAIGGGHGLWVPVPSRSWLRAVLSRKDAGGPFPPINSTLTLDGLYAEELDKECL